ncbi:MAG TPA: protoheme IX farnesyltransferase [Dehalococcoidia bacterium]|nr:protoheme IX farnesyltransferase [Dehalococcoidia bacterium]
MSSKTQSPSISLSSRRLRSILRDYLTLMKPSIVLLLLITTVPAMFLAAGAWPGSMIVTATMIGGILSAGGASSINMAIDSDIDSLMKRTRNRPIPRGTITQKNAVIFGLILGIASGIWMWITVNPLSAILSISAYVFYAGIYSPILKRKTVHNTVLGGIAGAMPALIGWTAISNQITIEGIALFVIVFCWQPPHFWALALGLYEDYENADIPMAPNVVGNEYTKRQIVLWSLLTVASTIAFFFVASMGLIFIIVAIITGLRFIYVSIQVAKGEQLEHTQTLWRYSTIYLSVLFGAMIIDEIYKF